MTEGDEEPRRLLNSFQLSSVIAGEPPFMKKRTHPANLRFHKVKEENNPHNFYFSELLLYYPHFDEEEIFPNDEHECTMLYLEKQEQIAKVKSQVMEWLQAVEEARYFVEKSLIEQKSMEGQLDPTGEQENDDCEYEGLIEDPNFLQFDEDEVSDDKKRTNNEKIFRPIEVEDTKTLFEKARMLDTYQRRVLDICLTHAKDLVKALKQNKKPPKAPKLMVHGGAGCGKSTVINVIKQFLHLILQKPGDNPDHPYVLVTGPTGTAAANVNGQTLHTTFNFKFGNQYRSLADKTRDQTRCTLQNLCFLIIDEISMVSSLFLK